MDSQLSLFKVYNSQNVSKNLQKVFESGYITQGKQVDLFEQELAAFLNNTPESIVTVNSCTSAIFLALHMLKEPNAEFNWPGIDSETDFVLSCPLTCTATNWPILHNGLKPRWVDVNQVNCCMDLIDLERKLDANTKVVLLMHWGGYPVNLATIEYLQQQHEKNHGYRFIVIQDAAHAFGAKFADKPIGSSVYNDITCFSFQAIKLLTTGDGGCLTFGSSPFMKHLAKRARLLRWYGISRESRSPDKESKSIDFRLEPDVSEAGFKMHMNDLNASIGRTNLKDIPKLLEKTRKNAELLREELPKEVLLQNDLQFVNPSYWLFSIRISCKTEFMEYMKDRGVMTSQVHKRNDTHSCVSAFKEPLHHLDHCEKELVCIPVGWWISEPELRTLVVFIRQFLNSSNY